MKLTSTVAMVTALDASGPWDFARAGEITTPSPPPCVTCDSREHGIYHLINNFKLKSDNGENLEILYDVHFEIGHGLVTY